MGWEGIGWVGRWDVWFGFGSYFFQIYINININPHTYMHEDTYPPTPIGGGDPRGDAGAAETVEADGATDGLVLLIFGVGLVWCWFNLW